MIARRQFLKAASGLFVPAVMGAVLPAHRRIVPRPPASSATTPASFSGLLAWWKADSLSLSNNDPVSSWTDSSGNGKTATGSSITRPLYKTSIFGSMPAVVFDGSDDEMSFSNTSLTTEGAYTIIWVGKISADSIIVGNDTTNIQIRKYRSSSNNISKFFDSIDQQSSAFSTAFNAAVMCTWRRPAGSVTVNTFFENATTRGTANDTNGFTLNRIGRTSYGGFANGSFGEICIYNSNLSDANISSLYADYFAGRWGI